MFIPQFVASQRRRRGGLPHGDMMAPFTVVEASAPMDATGPDRRPTSAYTVKDTAVSAAHTISTAAGVIPANQPIARRLYIKDNGRTQAIYYVGTGPLAANRAGVNIDLATGLLTNFATGTGTVISKSIAPVTGGWYQVDMLVSIGDANVATHLRLCIPTFNGTYVGDGTSGVLVY